ncbi:MAG: response regulator, partial [Bryobacteraceae bacterium]|nr:response regulator [Bryobacteraceae bacterium]
TRQLLAFSRRQIVQPKVVDPMALIEDMRPMLQRLLGEDVKLIIRSQEEGARIRVDPGNLGQVMVNMIVNARDAMPGAGTVQINLRSVYIGPEITHKYITLGEGHYILIEVTDTGTGMSAEVLNHLFEPFFTTKDKGHATGLGLSTSYGIVKQNKGEILVRSILGLGSTFSIYLPRVSESIDEPAALEAPLRSFRGEEVILLAEDEDGVRKVVTEMLRTAGYAVLAATGGSHALEIALRADQSIDLLITDMVMPGMSGRELADRLRALQPGTKVLFVSGYTENGIVNEGELEKGTAFLHKPFTPDQLARKVREVLEYDASAIPVK